MTLSVVPAMPAVCRRVAADRRVLKRHRPGVSHPEECGRCGDPWPCEDVRDLAHGLGIDTEETDRD